MRHVVTMPASVPAAKHAVEVPSLAAVELFAGAGGMAIGVHRAGFEILDLVELNEACCETLRANADHMGWKDPRDIVARDVRQLDFTSYRGAIALLTAGAPCQPFSHGGRRKGHHDERDMLPQVVRVIAQCQPRAFVVENVRGLLFKDSIDYLESIVARLRNPTVDDPSVRGCEDLYHYAAPPMSAEDDYRVEYRLLNAADYGLGQYRPRLFIVGVAQDEANFVWPRGTHSRASLIEDLRGDRYWHDHPEAPKAARTRARALLPRTELNRDGPRWRTLRDLVIDLGHPAASLREAEDPAHLFVPGARLYGKHTGSRIDWVSKTVKAGVHGSPGGEHIVVTTDKR
jgi:DNA (cytosine-5)-methyltransferase 1